ncbi:hypothetical protein AGABI1DRAFT_108190 [Agaricus bisporus var. burnettii JB137-S8]|uniref:Uncharacterized protein n=1 Tax=Agaricus bisporus var. burnettii (strain JB137-S8 / ATCC MYA-4627 / FGSC 10392) TaxID=597362 RepID=K5X348_AGABU|nr:uncharacterized protein AGABI1DRAFT_108190 [Agaricus bisporus var. burnettii JB137-S8]EKM77352.1 hypothetical protein AGABI1DRAFT_108190 [Agaricus bisporus var. burnettii JB137-S8]
MSVEIPRFRRRNTAKGVTRRDMVHNLVDILLEDGGVPKQPEQAAKPASDEGISPIEQSAQDSDAEAFNKFSQQMNNFDQELRDFANATRPLGSSIAILSSSFHLRVRLAHVLFLYRENAADLFPRKVTRVSRNSLNDACQPRRIVKSLARIARPIVNEDSDIDVEDFPDQMERFAGDIKEFLDCLNEFPEFTDEAINVSILSFSSDLQYWASCLREYKGQFRTPAVQRYLHEISIEMGEYIEDITSTLSIFIQIGVPIIQFSQKHAASSLLNLSAVATLFSGVTATTLQYSYQLELNRLSIFVNTLWFSSLVFSIAAVVNSLLGSTWKQTLYRSPGHRVPWWILIWIKRAPIVFLVLSVACFSFGLSLFAYASSQSAITSTITMVLTVLTLFSLCLVSVWLIAERWVSIRYRGKKWLDDALSDIAVALLQTNMLDVARRALNKLGSSVVFACIYTFVAFRRRFKLFNDPQTLGTDNQGGTLPVSSRDVSGFGFPGFSQDGRAYTMDEYELPISEKSPTSDVRSSTRSQSSSSMLLSPEGLSFSGPLPTSPGKQRWRDAYRLISASNALQSKPKRNPLSRSGSRMGPSATKSSAAKLRSRPADLAARLRILEVVQDSPAHSALVRHLQFSPNGKYLATSSWDRTSVIFKVGHPLTPHRVLAHARGFVGQVAWSPGGNYLLTKVTKGIKVWTAEDGVCKKTISREGQVEAVNWCHFDKKFMSVEGNKIFQLDITGREFAVFDFGFVKIHDVAITPDDKRILAVGPVLQSPSGLKPSRSRSEKRLIVFNTELQQIECQVPVLNDVRSITLVEMHRGALVALISYENKAPPQLWKLEIIKGNDVSRESSRLTLRHTYVPENTVDFAGPSYFGGHNHELVLCAGKKGDIFIWGTESGALLRHILPQAHSGDLTCIAWNQAASDSFMFATGSHNGAVRIWAKPSDSPRKLVNEESSPRSGA